MNKTYENNEFGTFVQKKKKSKNSKKIFIFFENKKNISKFTKILMSKRFISNQLNNQIIRIVSIKQRIIYCFFFLKKKKLNF